METGFYCPECLEQLVWISTYRREYLWCAARCDVRYTEDEALSYEQLPDELVSRVKDWEGKPHHWDYVCPNCKSTQRVILDIPLALGQRGDKCICLNCLEELVARVPYSAFTK